MAESSPSEPTSAEALARLSDSDLRAVVLDNIEASDTARRGFNPADIAYALQEGFAQLQERLGAVLGSYRELPQAVDLAVIALMENRDSAGLGPFLILFISALIVGGLCFRALKPLQSRLFGPVAAANTPIDLQQKCRYLGAALASDGMRVAAFAISAGLVFLILGTDEPRDRLAFAFYLSATIIMLTVTVFLRAYLCLEQPAYRIPHMDDRSARALFSTQLIATFLGAFGFFTCSLFAVLGVVGDAHYLFLMLVGTVLTAALVMSFLINRYGLVRAITAGSENGARTRLAPLYPWALMALAVGLFAGLVITGLLGGQALFGAGLFTLGALTYWPPFDAALAAGARQYHAAGNALHGAILRVMRLSLGVSVILALILVWRFDLFGLYGPVGLGVTITRAILQIGFVALIAYAAWESLRLHLDKRIAREQAEFEAQHGDIGEMEIGGAGMSRLGTLLPLIKRTGQVLIATISLMIILSSLGLDIGPILAGAGVVGLAIGFGSQTLVRDIVSGAFFLIDDAFRQGEYIDLGDVKGSVEKIRARSLQLRHHRGALNTIPFGEISTVQNYSRDWAIMKLRFRLAFNTDLEKVRKLLKKTGLALLDHPEVGEDFLQPFKSQGVIEVDDYGLVISTKFMCKPGRQFLIRRYAYAAVQETFAAHDIQFSRPEVRVAMEADGVETQTEAHTEAMTKTTASEAVATVMARRDTTKPQSPE
ncbi:MAG: mechanosensitive ion channel family protein [Pseudomonadota bacterium]